MASGQGQVCGKVTHWMVKGKENDKTYLALRCSRVSGDIVMEVPSNRNLKPKIMSCSAFKAATRLPCWGPLN